MIKTEIKLSLSSRLMLDRKPREFRRGLSKGMKRAMLYSEAKVKEGFEGGRGKNRLKNKTGALRRSIRSQITKDSGSIVRGTVGSDLVYSLIHETGGTITARGAFLQFRVAGRWVRIKQVRIPKTEYLSAPILENVEKIKSIITRSIIGEVGVI